MTKVLRTVRAEQDLIDIWLHIAGDNEAAANALLDQIETICLRRAEHPRLGPARRDITHDLGVSRTSLSHFPYCSCCEPC